ncbi:MAG: PucR family transcriptional regulator [Butyricicoccus sp.]
MERVTRLAVNSYLIYEGLKQNTQFTITAEKISGSTMECEIKHVTIYNPLIAIKNNTAYILLEPDHFPVGRESESCLMLVMGRLSSRLMEKTQHEVLCLEPSCGLGALYEYLGCILERYNRWEEELTGVLLRGGSLDELCSLSAPWFGNPLTVQNGNFQLLGVGESGNICYPYCFREGDSDYLADSWIKEALKQPDIVFQDGEPFVFQYISAHKSLLLNLFEDGRYQAQICVDACCRPLERGDSVRLGILGRYVSQCLNRKTRSEYGLDSRFRTQLKAFVREKKNNRRELEQSMVKSGWTPEENYICCIVQGSEDAAGQTGTEYGCRRWEKLIPHSVCFASGGLFYLLIAVGTAETLSRAQSKALLQESRSNGCRIGVSSWFAGAFDCRNYFLQAAAAIKAGRTSKHGGAVYSFCDYALDYAVRYGVGSLPLETMIPRNLQKLIKLDEESGKGYLMTLDAYLRNNMNISETVAELYVHRSTFQYRLKKIEEIMDTDLSDPREQMYLRMLLYLLDTQEEQEVRKTG